MKIRNKWIALVITTSFVIAGSISLVFAAAGDKHRGRGERENIDKSLGGGSGGMPTKMATNAHVELADGERYILSGIVEINHDAVYLNIDFDDQPWLASGRRKVEPYYLIDDVVGKWTKFNGKRVSVNVVAHGMVNDIGGGRYIYSIYLESTRDPAIIGGTSLRD